MPKKNHTDNQYDPKVSALFRSAAEQGDVGKVQSYLRQAKQNDEFNIDVKVSFDLAAMHGHLNIVRFLFGHLSSPNDAISGLFEACRYGQFLTAQWILDRKSLNLTQDTLMVALRTAGLNQHWSIMQFIMHKIGLYIESRTNSTAPDFDQLTMRSLLQSNTAQAVKVPSQCIIPQPIMDEGRSNLRYCVPAHK